MNRPRTTAARIHEHYAKRGDRRSNGLGISTLGHECERALWYGFRWATSGERFDGRMRRLFETGNREEARVVEDLRAIGYEVEDRDPATGEQFRVEFFGGHLSGYADGKVHGCAEEPANWYVVEVKTHNANSFDKLTAKGVEKAQPKHFVQAQLYPLALGLPGTLYVAVCKDTDDIYSELVPLNRKKAEAMLAKAERVIFAERPPERVKDTPDFPPCSWCAYRQICHESTAERPVTPSRNCRTCVHATVERDGSWSCEAKGIVLSKERQEGGCDDQHLFRPDLLPFGAPVHAESGFVVYPGMRVNVSGTGVVTRE